MLVDLTLALTPETVALLSGADRPVPYGHLGTHFDVMDKVFPLSYLQRPAVVFDLSAVAGREIDIGDIDCRQIEAGMFVAFYTGFIARCPYGCAEYFKSHPQLAHGLIRRLVETGVAIIGLDFAGLRRGAEHTPTDQYCADHGVFVVENLVNLERLLEGQPSVRFTANTYPMNFTGQTGLPCRVVGEAVLNQRPG